MIGVDLGSAEIAVGVPNRSHAKGHVTIQDGTVQVVSSLRRDLLSARTKKKAESVPESLDPLGEGLLNVTMPTQTVVFQVERGSIDQKGMRMDMDGIEVTTRGEVSLDGWVNMIAAVPRAALNPSGDFAPDEMFHVLVSGNMFNPHIDPLGIGNMALVVRNQLRAGANLANQLLGVMNRFEPAETPTESTTPVSTKNPQE